MDFVISIISLYITYLILKAIFNGLRKIFFNSNAQNEKDAHTKKIETSQTTKSSPTHTSGNLNWKIENNVLIIGGVGDMENYSEEKTPPWHNKHEEIKKVIIESGITIIGDCAFRGLKNLEEVIISNDVNAIGVRAFESCKSLKKVTFPKNVLTIIGVSAFASCTSLEKVQINAEFIGVSAFTNCTSLANITFTENVVAIFDGAFNNCTSLTEIKIPASVTSINEKIFDGCLRLQKIFYPAGSDPEKKLQVGNNAQLIPFGEPHNISSKTSTTAQVSLIGNNGQLVPFEKQRTISPEITETKKVNVKQDNQSRPVKSSQTYTQENSQWNSAGNLRWRVRDNTLTISGKGNMDNYSLKHLPPWGEKQDVIRRIVVEHGVTSIGNGAFFAHTELKTITLPKTIKSIGASAFFGCALTKIELPYTLKEIGPMAFAGCILLTEIVIPESVTRMGENVFERCSNLQRIYYPLSTGFDYSAIVSENARLIPY